ncbi:hypothetical protein [Devriesea agamarum]|uniref:hypothetical protein n=1 Tax=Devriesea agamarum TaxID=472569 RepID=UPI00071D6885|nr:hypothetical protein [Devriesea agamarum]
MTDLSLPATLPIIVTWLATIVVASLGGWPVTTGVLKLARIPRKLTSTPVRGTVLLAAPKKPDETSYTIGSQPHEMLRGGLWIGLLERAGIALCILGETPELIAVVVALKGLGRYPELKGNSGAGERFLVGSFASFLWAAVIAVIGRFAILLTL